jgi:hypothetical protein
VVTLSCFIGANSFSLAMFVSTEQINCIQMKAFFRHHMFMSQLEQIGFEVTRGPSKILSLVEVSPRVHDG